MRSRSSVSQRLQVGEFHQLGGAPARLPVQLRDDAVEQVEHRQRGVDEVGVAEQVVARDLAEAVETVESLSSSRMSSRARRMACGFRRSHSANRSSAPSTGSGGT